jgi:hypothetical protein
VAVDGAHRRLIDGSSVGSSGVERRISFLGTAHVQALEMSSVSIAIHWLAFVKGGGARMFAFAWVGMSVNSLALVKPL